MLQKEVRVRIETLLVQLIKHDVVRTVFEEAVASAEAVQPASTAPKIKRAVTINAFKETDVSVRDASKTITVQSVSPAVQVQTWTELHRRTLLSTERLPGYRKLLQKNLFSGKLRGDVNTAVLYCRSRGVCHSFNFVGHRGLSATTEATPTGKSTHPYHRYSLRGTL